MKTTNKFVSINEERYGGSMSNLLRREGMIEIDNPQLSTIIVFNGGEDIATEIYGEYPIYRGIPAIMSHRDSVEVELYNAYRDDPTKLKVGICRGAQLLNCLNGGTLWQDVNNHNRNHSMTIVETGHKMQITSTHHQMMRPNWDEAVIIGVADESTFKHAEKEYYPHGSFKDDNRDTEILYYPKTHTLCIQGHPEYIPGSEFADYCVGLINKYVKELKNVSQAA